MITDWAEMLRARCCLSRLEKFRAPQAKRGGGVHTAHCTGWGQHKIEKRTQALEKNVFSFDFNVLNNIVKFCGKNSLKYVGIVCLLINGDESE